MGNQFVFPMTIPNLNVPSKAAGKWTFRLVFPNLCGERIVPLPTNW